MAIEGQRFEFADKLPAVEAIVREVERLTGMGVIAKPDMSAASTQELAGVPPAPRTVYIGFASLPGAVQLQFETACTRITLIHRAGTAPVLFQLLCHALTRQGGTSRFPNAPLPLPLTPAQVEQLTRKQQRELRRMSLAMVAMAVLLVSGIAALIGLAIWAVWRQLV